jgi:hypothetical protein
VLVEVLADLDVGDHVERRGVGHVVDGELGVVVDGVEQLDAGVPGAGHLARPFWRTEADRPSTPAGA